MISNQQKIIAIDFDGTIVKDEYPKIGTEQLFAFETMKKMLDHGYRLVLWTLRDGDKLKEAVEFCRSNGVEFYAVNANYPEETFREDTIRKLSADIFIDDRNIGGFIGWGEVYKIFFGQEGKVPTQKKKSGFLGFFNK